MTLKKYSLSLFRKKTPPIHVKVIPFDVNKSFLRIGDGEMLIAMGMGIDLKAIGGFSQEANKDLTEKMKKIIGYTGKKIIIALPLKYIIKEEKDTESIEHRKMPRLYFNKKINPNEEYGDAFFFRDIGNYEEFCNLYKNKDIYLVVNKETIDKITNSKYLLNIKGLCEIPKYNSYRQYKKIKDKIINDYKKMDPKRSIIIISGGPMAKILTYELSLEKGYVCHDVGAIFDFYL